MACHQDNWSFIEKVFSLDVFLSHTNRIKSRHSNNSYDLIISMLAISSSCVWTNLWLIAYGIKIKQNKKHAHLLLIFKVFLFNCRAKIIIFFPASLVVAFFFFYLICDHWQRLIFIYTCIPVWSFYEIALFYFFIYTHK